MPEPKKLQEKNNEGGKKISVNQSLSWRDSKKSHHHNAGSHIQHLTWRVRERDS